MGLAILAGALLGAQAIAGAQPVAGPAATATAPAAASSAINPALVEAERAARSAEAWERQGREAWSEGEDEAKALQAARDGLSRYLYAHPNDVRALLLKARVLRALIVVTPVVVTLDDGGRGTIKDNAMRDVRREARAALEQVMVLEPGNAEAHYWMARTLILSSEDAVRVGAEEGRDLDLVLAEAKKAVSLDPDSPVYREYRALVLYGTGQQEEALRELAKLPGKHAALQLLDDKKTVPAPGGSAMDGGLSNETIKALFSGRMDVFNFAGLRTWSYAFPGTVAEVKAAYAKSLPGIRWVGSGKGDPAYAAFLWRGDRLEPAADPAPFMHGDGKQLQPSGLLLSLLRDGDKTTMLVINFRQF